MSQSNFYRDYKTARDKAWEIIFKYGVNELPISLNELCRHMGILLFSYTSGIKMIKKYKLELYMENDAFSTIIQNNYVIFYDESKPVRRRRFTVAHEIGHIVLGHVTPTSIACRNSVTCWNCGEDTGPNPCEAAANIFASRLLAPACVLWALGVHSASEIESLCGLSKQAAQIRAQRMEALYRKNYFLRSPLEQKALLQFSAFIQKQLEEKNA